MKRHQQENKNTEAWWKWYSEQPQSNTENRAIADVMFLLKLISRGAMRVLDVGCWRGHYFKCFPQDAEIHGIDLCKEALEIARENYPDAVLQHCNVANGLPYPDNHFDVVYFGEILEHLEDPAALCREVFRVLKPGGHAIANTPFEDSIPCEAHVWFIDMKDIRSMFSEFERPTVYRFSNSAKHKWEHFLIVARKPT